MGPEETRPGRGRARERGGAGEPAPDTAAFGLGKPGLLAVVGGGVLLLDQVTKWWIVRSLTLHEIVPVWGDFFRLTYTHNFGAAFGIDVGQYSRVFFLTLALVALGVLMYLFVRTPEWRRLRLWALSLISGGALGNIIDRIRFRAGVVDFLDVGFGSIRWPVFNVADMGVSIGAILLVVTFYREETRPERSDRPGIRDGGRATSARERAARGSDERVPATEG